MIKLRDQLRLRLGNLDDQLLLTVLAIVVGTFSGLISIAFRYLIEAFSWSTSFLVFGDTFESLQVSDRLLLPLLGAFALGLVLSRLPAAYRPVGIAHVIERVANYQGYMHWKNAVVQFFLGAWAIASGQSVGREGPCVHLGAASASYLAQWMKVPNNSIRVLIGCGVAAGISASFDTPLAGVIFAMEVVLLEYALNSFIPVIVASVIGAVIARLFFGHEVAFLVPNMDLASLAELPLFMLMGIVIGCASALFIRGASWLSIRGEQLPILLRFTLAGLGVGILASMQPQIMGVGYDTVNAALDGQLAFTSLLVIGVFKFLASLLCVGLAMPAGVIGPLFVIGACFGGVFALAYHWLFPGLSPVGFYVLIAMAAMMSSTLAAPMAALIALMELSGSPNMLLPAMLAVISANLVVRQYFKLPSIFHYLIETQGRSLKVSPLAQLLRNIGVVGVMERNFVISPRQVDHQQAEALLASSPIWIVVQTEDEQSHLLAANDLARILHDSEQQIFDLLDIPGTRFSLCGVYFQANLEEAIEALDESQAEAIYIYRHGLKGAEKIYGVMTRADIEAQYKYQPVRGESARK